MASLRIGLCFHESALSNEESFRDLDVVVFPELVDGGYQSLPGKSPHTESSSIFQSFRLLSQRRPLLVVAGTLFYRHRRSRPTNTNLVFHKGRVIHTYDKIHLFKPCNDHRYFRSGKRTGTFVYDAVPGRLRCGVVICYDIRFPEIVRSLALKRMNILFVPARWPVSRNDAWFTLLKARAIENQIFVVGCNAAGPEGGNSYIFGPEGEVLLSCEDGDIMRWADLDLSMLDRSRVLHNNMNDAVLLRKRGR